MPSSTPSDVNELLKSIVLVTLPKAALFSCLSTHLHMWAFSAMPVKWSVFKCLSLSLTHFFSSSFALQVSSIQINRSISPHTNALTDGGQQRYRIRSGGKSHSHKISICVLPRYKSNSFYYYWKYSRTNQIKWLFTLCSLLCFIIKVFALLYEYYIAVIVYSRWNILLNCHFSEIFCNDFWLHFAL